jgi:hypothetical protein
LVKHIVVHARRTPRFLSSTSHIGCCRIAINSRFERHATKVAVEVQLIISSSVDIEAINSTNFKAGRRYIDDGGHYLVTVLSMFNKVPCQSSKRRWIQHCGSSRSAGLDRLVLKLSRGDDHDGAPIVSFTIRLEDAVAISIKNGCRVFLVDLRGNSCIATRLG